MDHYGDNIPIIKVVSHLISRYRNLYFVSLLQTTLKST